VSGVRPQVKGCRVLFLVVMSPHRQGRAGPDGERAIELVPDPDRPRAWTLLVDGTPQSHVDLDDPRHLEFEYMRRLGHLIDLAAPPARPLRVLHLGAGALTLARYVAATRPGSAQLAVESDAAVVELVRRRLPLAQRSRRTAAGHTATAQTAAGQTPASQAGRVRIRVGDARAVLEQVRAGSYDLVIADLFDGARTPAHLTSVEFVAAASRALTPSGIYAANVGDGPPLMHARAQVATVRSLLPHACLIADASVLRGRRFGNLILAASAAPLPVAGLARRAAGDPFPARVVHGDDLVTFTGGARPVTDARARPSPAPPSNLFGLPTAGGGGPARS
jgi:spermidine synthase